MPRLNTFFATFKRTLPRAAAAVLLAVPIISLSPEAVFASHGADDAAAVATDSATQSATDQATAAATEQAAEAASEQATEQAAEQAAESANDQAVSGAEDKAAENSMDGGSSGMGSDDGMAMSSAEDRNNGTEKTADTAVIEITRERDGSEVRAHEIVVMLDQRDEDAVRKAGFNVVAQASLISLGGELLRIRVPDAASTSDALDTIRAAAPDAIVAANYVYRTADGPAAAVAAVNPARARAADNAAKSYEGLAGIVDTAVDRTYPGLEPAVADIRSFADGLPSDAVHGTAVADIVARQNVRILAADVFAKDTAGDGAATTAAILRALDWLVSRGVTVINMSIEGPSDAAMGEAIRRAQAKGCVIVAAAGNKGPAAPPVYPAAFPSVVAVTAIDKQDRIYRYANQGPYISFAALGVDVDTALPPGGRRTSSGTSFSAPIVTALIARLDRNRTVDSAQATLALLAAQARHLGVPGRNPVFGMGALDGTMAAYPGE